MDSTFRRALWLAAGAHVLALAVIGASRSPETTPSAELPFEPPTTFTTEMFAVQLLDEEPGSAPASIATGAEPPAEKVASATTPSPHLAIVGTTKPKTSEPPATTTTTEGTIEPPASTATSPTTATPTTIGTGTSKAPYVVPELGKKSSWLLPPILPDAVGAAGTSSPLDPKSEQKTKEEKLAAKLSKDVTTAVDAQGKTKGGGFGGPVIGAAHSAAHDDPLAPETGIAVFEVKTDATGAVKSVTVLSSDGDGPGWIAVAATIKKDLGTKKLVVPSGAGGVKVTVRVQAKFALPSGATGSGVKPYVAGLGGGFGFDLSDIGQKPMRVISVTEIEESRL